MYLLLILNDKFEMRLTKLDLIQIVFFVLLFINIKWIYHLGFLITYIILNVIELLSTHVSSYDSLKKRYIISLSISFVILPFNQQISILGLVFFPILLFIISYVILSLTIIVLFLPEFDAILEMFYEWFVFFVSKINDKNLLFYLPSLNPVLIVIYFLILFYLFQSQTIKHLFKRLCILISLFSIPIFEQKLTNQIKIYFLDVGQGDTIFIQSKDCNIMVDAFYGSDTFLIDLGIYKLDYLILTHSDDDHTRLAESIIKKTKVEQLLINPFDPNYQNYPVETSKIYANHRLNCGNIQLDFYSPWEKSSSSNNNSLVFELTAMNYQVLFTGDIEQEVELKLVDRYKDQIKTDVLKVAHHGSETSSSLAFLKVANPKTSIISVAKHNRFGFPHDEVIERLKINGSRIYRTDTSGTILLTLEEKNVKWSFFLPF
jgi:beta-lactamase superfamily II metal-dependent hydrolase